MPKLHPNIESAKPSSSFMHALKKDILLHLQTWAN